MDITQLTMVIGCEDKELSCGGMLALKDRVIYSEDIDTLLAVSRAIRKTCVYDNSCDELYRYGNHIVVKADDMSLPDYYLVVAHYDLTIDSINIGSVIPIDKDHIELFPPNPVADIS